MNKIFLSDEEAIDFFEKISDSNRIQRFVFEFLNDNNLINLEENSKKENLKNERID